MKLQFLLLNHILKWKDCQLDSLGHCFRSSLRGINCLPFIKLIQDRAEISRSFLENIRSGKKNKSTSLVESRDVNIRRHFVRFGLPCHIVATSASVTIGLHEICGLISVTHSPSKLRRVWPRRVWAVWGLFDGDDRGEIGSPTEYP